MGGIQPWLTIVVSLWICPASWASYGVALILGIQDDGLESALKVRHFVTTSHANIDHDEFHFLVQNFVRTVPTNGTALIYLAGEHDLPTDLFKWLREESGAAHSIIIVRGDRLPVDDPNENSSTMICWTAEGFVDSLTEFLANRKVDLPSAIGKAVAATGGWTSTLENPMPPLNAAIAPPTTIAEGRQVGDEWVSLLGTVFCWCPPGRFVMEKLGGPVEVNFPKGFWLGKYELTKREFDLVTRKNPRHAMASHPSHPRDGIRHDDILRYVNELNGRSRFTKHLPDEWEYALPSESEWEYACRAGTSTPFYFGKDETHLAENANFADRRLFETGDDFYHYANRLFDDGVPRLAVVGCYSPNPWGLHDMYGNLWEWTNSYDTDAMSRGIPVARGGSWVSLENYCGSTSRRQFDYQTERNFIGFRLALRPVQSP